MRIFIADAEHNPLLKGFYGPGLYVAVADSLDEALEKIRAKIEDNERLRAYGNQKWWIDKYGPQDHHNKITEQCKELSNLEIKNISKYAWYSLELDEIKNLLIVQRPSE